MCEYQVEVEGCQSGGITNRIHPVNGGRGTGPDNTLWQPPADNVDLYNCVWRILQDHHHWTSEHCRDEHADFFRGGRHHSLHWWLCFLQVEEETQWYQVQGRCHCPGEWRRACNKHLECSQVQGQAHQPVEGWTMYVCWIRKCFSFLISIFCGECISNSIHREMCWQWYRTRLFPQCDSSFRYFIERRCVIRYDLIIL